MPQYNDTILNYYNDNTFIGSFNAKDKNIGTGLVGSPSCGDVMKLQIKVEKDEKTGNETIIDAKILVFGCGSAKASSSYVAKKLIGKTLEEARQIKNTDIANALGLPKIKLHCSVLAEEAIKRAIDDYKNASLQNNTKKEMDDIKQEQNNVDVNITAAAINFIKQTLAKVDKKNIIGIRIGLEEGHCGLTYKVRYVLDDDNIDNLLCIEKDSIKIFINSQEANIIAGTKIDYKEEGLKRGLIFNNAHETGKCSCGQNFFIKDGTTNVSKNDH